MLIRFMFTAFENLCWEIAGYLGEIFEAAFCFLAIKHKTRENMLFSCCWRTQLFGCILFEGFSGKLENGQF